MIDLKSVITKYPECLNTSDKLKAYLTDIYPDEKARVRIIVSIYYCGIVDEIKKSTAVDEITIIRYCNKLENEFGFSKKLSYECINLWLEVYEKSIPKSLISNDIEHPVASKIDTTVDDEKKFSIFCDKYKQDSIIVKHINKSFVNSQKLQTTESNRKSNYDDYGIKDAIYSHFPEIEKLIPKEECNAFEDVVLESYRNNKKLGLSVWLWILNKFPHALTNDVKNPWIICNNILSKFGSCDLATQEDCAYKYLSQHPELEVLIFQMPFYIKLPEVVSEYLSYCIAHGLQKNFERVYSVFMENSLLCNFIIRKKELVLEKTIEYYRRVYLKPISLDFYTFLKNEILSLEKNVKRNQILYALNLSR